MLKKIGETEDNLDVFELSETIAVDEDGIIYKIDKDELCDSIYCVANFEDRESEDDVRSHIINPFKLIVDKHRIDIVNNKIDGEVYEYIDDESNDFVLIKFKNNKLKLNDDGTSSIEIKNDNFKKHIEAIEKAYDNEVDEFEDFFNLKF
ncbi:MAG: hypothetical protein GY932_15230 [Arcobacter sp.]|nr:hypothetical protein [Arcobacter sp.]